MTFKKGQIPWNKGKHPGNKLLGKKWRIKDTSKMGHKPANYIDGRSKGKYSSGIYGRFWKEQREATLIRDDFTCQYCGRSECLLHIHHKIPFKLTKDNSLNNLITLCSRCHNQEHKRLREELNKQRIKN